jgi:autophagy-related protein 11
MVQIPPTLASLQASFRGKNSFSHIQRLHSMLYAYGATVIEIVRRKEFCELLFLVSDYVMSDRGLKHDSSTSEHIVSWRSWPNSRECLFNSPSSDLQNIISASERKRRQVYRGEVYGQLPFETRGMDDPVPTIDFSPSGNLDAPYPLEREDVDGTYEDYNFFFVNSSRYFQAFSVSWMTWKSILGSIMTQLLSRQCESAGLLWIN